MAARTNEPSALPQEVATLIGQRHVIVASNRGPVEFIRGAGGRLTTRRGAGGVVTALAMLAHDLPMTWVAATMSEADREAFPAGSAAAREVRLGRQPLRVRYVNVPPEMYTRYYDVVSNELLWFLQHYMWDPATTPTFTEQHYTAWDQGYRPVNFAIAQAIADEALAATRQLPRRGARSTDGSDTIVLLQDYHLYLTAARVRERLPRASIQQFIHIPWPTMRYWQFLPERFVLEIFEGLAANDVLGFQTEEDARNFLECARCFLPDIRIDLDQGRLIRRRHRLLARAYPVAVDAAEIMHTANSAAGRTGARELGRLLDDDAQVIVRVDRLEPTKNIVRGFQAYEALLHHHPELHGHVRHLAFLVPSRQELDRYRRYDRDVRRIIHRINAEFGTPDWQPITAFFENNRARALAAMRRYDVLLVNPVIDGMNLVVKEGPVINERDGVVVLSRTAGAFQQMRRAVLPVTPTDIEETREQLYEALHMSAHERQERARLAHEIATSRTPAAWVLDQLSAAAAIRAAAPKGARAMAGALPRAG
ncbi:MAG TPA: trehalose-6-phosphate synthase [Ktedonobacterales bacterium]|nr:trehalose-6-phosphate synthase [Ktedonobacterales bacterium]